MHGSQILTSIEGFSGGQERREFPQWRSCWKYQVYEALRASQYPEGLLLLCCCSVRAWKVKAEHHTLLNTMRTRRTEIFSSCWRTYTIWRFVKLPILGERVPDKLWLGVPLQNKDHFNYFIMHSLYFLIPSNHVALKWI